MIDTSTPQSPGWYMQRLLRKLGDRQQRLNDLEKVYEGTNAIPIATDKSVRDSYRRLMRFAHTNFAELCVEALRERMAPTGFRTGADGDKNGDKEAWRIWQANGLDQASIVHTRSYLSLSLGYMIVGPKDPTIDAPLITPEDPREVITYQDPANRRVTRAALKVFHDEDAQLDRAYVYLPGFVFKATRPRKTKLTFRWTMSGWDWDPDQPVQRLPAPVVPVIPFVNRATLAGAGKAEFETHQGILDRINYTILNRVEIATLQAFRQRAAKGMPDKDDQGVPIDYTDIFNADPGAIWLLPKTAELWESKEVDLGPIRSAVRDDIQDFAAVSRTPLYYLTPEAANGSAEGASLAREGLVFKALDRMTEASDPYEQTMATAFAMVGDRQRANRRDMEIIWRSPERFSLAERYDAAAKAIAAGVPWRSVMLYVLQFSPQEVDRMEAERAGDVLLAGLIPQQDEKVSGAGS